MSFFEKRDANVPDQVLVPLSVGGAARLVSLAKRAASARGLRLRYDGSGALVGPDGTMAGLTNLARVLSAEARWRWRRLVEEHFDLLAVTVRAAHDWPGPPAPGADQLYLRLVAAHGLPPGWSPDADEFVPGVLAVPATCGDHAVAMHSDPGPLGLTRAEATRIGLANLRRIPDDVEWLRHGGAEVAQITGSMFTASRALVLDTVLRETLRVENPSYGTLIAFPARDLLLVHVLEGDSLVAAMNLMVSTAIQAYGEWPGPISPHVYYAAAAGVWGSSSEGAVHSDFQSAASCQESSGWQQVTDCSAGAVRVLVDGPMLTAVRRLGLISE